MKELSREEMLRILHKVNDGVLGLSDGTKPYCIPFGFVYVNDAVYLSMFPHGRKWDYVTKNDHVCFNVFCWNDEHTEWYSVVIDGEMEQVNDLPGIEAVVRANILKMGLEPEKYLDNRMEYYKKSLDNPKSLKIFKIKTSSMTGRKMHTLLGEA